MLKKIKNIFFFISFCTFVIFITFYYFSDENIMKTNKIRSSYNLNFITEIYNLPLLKNNTNDIIEDTYPNFGFRNLRGYINQ